MRKTLILLLISMLVLTLLAGCSKPPQDPEVPRLAGEKLDPLNPVAIIEMEAGGVIEVELYRDVAPNTVRNFIHLANKGFYNGLDFGLLLPDLLIIGGLSPEGEPRYRIPGEFSANGFTNDLSHTRGVITMYNGGHPDSASSEFMIMVKDAPHLDGHYATFGNVILGMDVVDRIAAGPSDEEGRALEPREIIKLVTVDAVGQAYEEPEKVEEWDTTLPNPVVTLEIEAGGVITIELYPAIALNTVRNFVDLVQNGYYDGLKFHRIIPGFMAQGGDPLGTGSGGPGHYIYGEFALNGIMNTLSHDRGVISMARGEHPDSAGSQFFIMVAPNPGLDGAYAGFGKVIEGMEIVDRIVSGPSDQAQNGLALEPREQIKKATVDTFGVDFAPPVVITP